MRPQRTKSEAKYQQLVKWITEEEVRHPHTFRSPCFNSPVVPNPESVQQYSAGCITAPALLQTEISNLLNSSTHVLRQASIYRAAVRLAGLPPVPRRFCQRCYRLFTVQSADVIANAACPSCCQRVA